MTFWAKYEGCNLAETHTFSKIEKVINRVVVMLLKVRWPNLLKPFRFPFTSKRGREGPNILLLLFGLKSVGGARPPWPLK